MSKKDKLYIITESRLSELVDNYINSKDLWEWDIGDGEFNVADGRMSKDIIYYRISFEGREIIYINENFLKDVCYTFGFEKYSGVPYIINWFNKKYNKNLTMQDYGFILTDEEWEND